MDCLPEVIEQRSDVDPNASGFENVVNGLYEVYNIGGAVYKEARSHTVPLCFLGVHLKGAKGVSEGVCPSLPDSNEWDVRGYVVPPQSHLLP